ncbi:unnamed protein product [Prunus armeniaca]|uniref:Uncharacterized protein n=1 Tax=Prunus armeniaca TaxID=36596 RepID=A0A6J5Y896_PRUAR|nr:unnamed protein product [Prunus armeniaca]
MDFEEFCAAALSVHQLEALDHCEQHARCVYELFERDGNRAIVIEELHVGGRKHGICPILTFDVILELGFGPSIPLHVVLYDWIRHTDGNLDLLYGVSSQIFVKAQFGDLARWPIYSLLWHTMNEASLPIGGEGATNEIDPMKNQKPRGAKLDSSKDSTFF